MGQAAKASIKRKPSYFMAILGVTLVLFLLGVVGWLTINSKKLMQYFRESVEVQVFLQPNVKDTARVALQNYIASQPYTRSIKYTDIETAKKEWLKTGNEDFTQFIENSLLPTSIDFTIKENYLDSGKINAIKADIEQNPIVNEVKYPQAVVTSMQRNFKWLSLLFAGVAIIICILVIILIDNTIRLAMFSNRFLIKTMQMVGATRGFIARPLNVRAIINGAVSGLIASIVLFILIRLAENFVPDLVTLRDTSLLLLLFFVLIALGITITLFSTHRSVLKYLKMKLDDLY
jgi:cell division transport system permease protein